MAYFYCFTWYFITILVYQNYFLSTLTAWKGQVHFKYLYFGPILGIFWPISMDFGYFLRVKKSCKNSKKSRTNFFGFFWFSMAQTLKKKSYAPKRVRNDLRLAQNDPNWGFIFGIFHHFRQFLAHFASIFWLVLYQKLSWSFFNISGIPLTI